MSARIYPAAGLLELLILGAVFVVALAGAAYARRRRREVSTEPVCAGCGYAVRGLPTFICPECGSDLREVGILTPGMRYRTWRAVQSAARAAAGMARAVGRVVALRPPVTSFAGTVEKRHDGRVVFRPALSLP